MNADEIEAGRETDKLIAESLGWKFVSVPGFPEYEGTGPDGEDGMWPNYTTRIEDAWLLVAKIAEGKGGCPLFSLKLDRYVGKEWECLMGELAGDGTWTVEAKADTPELAICRCWLKSKERK